MMRVCLCLERRAKVYTLLCLYYENSMCHGRCCSSNYYLTNISQTFAIQCGVSSSLQAIVFFIVYHRTLPDGEIHYLTSLDGSTSAKQKWKYHFGLPKKYGTNGKHKTSHTERVFNINSANLYDQGVYTFSCVNCSNDIRGKSGVY